MRKATRVIARRLRRVAPLTERLLWKLLRDRRFAGLKFRRQVPIGPYVADFLCFHHRLIIEADGPLHDEAHDAVRDAYLRSQGFRVLRFDNGQIQNHTYKVLDTIERALRDPSPLAGEGGPEGVG